MLFALIQAVFANAGTPLMWGAALHLLAGNAIIGTFEGLLLITLFKARTKTTLLVMIAANYLSAWLGLLLIPAVANFADMDINTIRPWFWIMTGVTYGATVLIEWPFVIACVGTFRRSVLASFTVQAISYTLLFGFYWMLSTTSLFREVEIVPAREIPLPESVEFYYIGAGDGNVYHLGSTTGQPEMIHELKSKNPWDRLYWRASKAEPR
ncbi:MAG TPA: hypothetical protein VHM91_03525, partial [Verrucomicrobiales bacterium]|nr:hypothetical protein [Verrucomicrobiales bacterium]